MNKNELSKNDPPKDNQLIEVDLFKLVEMGNGTISIFSIRENLALGHRFIKIKQFPEKKFDLELDCEKVKQILDTYQQGGIEAAKMLL